MGTLRLRLHQADRDRLGCPEWLDVDPVTITNREAVQIRTVLGFATPQLLRDGLSVRPVLENGEEVVDSTGRPVQAIDPTAWTGLVWVALRRAGVDTDLATLEFAYEVIEFQVPEPADLIEAPSRGKGRTPARSRSTSSTTAS